MLITCLLREKRERERDLPTASCRILFVDDGVYTHPSRRILPWEQHSLDPFFSFPTALLFAFEAHVHSSEQMYLGDEYDQLACYSFALVLDAQDFDARTKKGQTNVTCVLLTFRGMEKGTDRLE